MRPSLYFNWDARSFVGHKYCALTLFSLHHGNSYVPQRLQCRCRVVPFWKVYVSASGSNLLRLVAVVPFDIQRICHSMPRSSVLCRCELGTQVCNTCSTERERPQLLILICVVILTSSEKTYMLVGCLWPLIRTSGFFFPPSCLAAVYLAAAVCPFGLVDSLFRGEISCGCAVWQVDFCWFQSSNKALKTKVCLMLGLTARSCFESPAVLTTLSLSYCWCWERTWRCLSAFQVQKMSCASAKKMDARAGCMKQTWPPASQYSLQTPETDPLLEWWFLLCCMRMLRFGNRTNVAQMKHTRGSHENGAWHAPWQPFTHLENLLRPKLWPKARKHWGTKTQSAEDSRNLSGKKLGASWSDCTILATADSFYTRKCIHLSSLKLHKQ